MLVQKALLEKIFRKKKIGRHGFVVYVLIYPNLEEIRQIPYEF